MCEALSFHTSTIPSQMELLEQKMKRLSESKRKLPPSELMRAADIRAKVSMKVWGREPGCG